MPISGELSFRKDGIGKEKAFVKVAPEWFESLLAVFLGPFSLLLDGDVAFEAELLFDAPIRIVFTDTADLRFGNNLTTFGVDLSDTPEAGAEFQVRQTNMPDEFGPEFSVDQEGVYYHRQDVVLDGPFWQHREEHRDHEFGDVGLYRWAECGQGDGWDDGEVCYWNDDATV